MSGKTFFTMILPKYLSRTPLGGTGL